VWCVVCGVWCVVCGVWCVVCGVWCMVCGLRVSFEIQMFDDFCYFVTHLPSAPACVAEVDQQPRLLCASGALWGLRGAACAIGRTEERCRCRSSCVVKHPDCMTCHVLFLQFVIVFASLSLRFGSVIASAAI
jgi:hypothetical protein